MCYIALYFIVKVTRATKCLHLPVCHRERLDTSGGLGEACFDELSSMVAGFKDALHQIKVQSIFTSVYKCTHRLPKTQVFMYIFWQCLKPNRLDMEIEVCRKLLLCCGTRESLPSNMRTSMAVETCMINKLKTHLVTASYDFWYMYPWLCTAPLSRLWFRALYKFSTIIIIIIIHIDR